MRTFHRWGDLLFIVDDFPNWMVIRTLVLDGGFSFLIAARLIRDN